MNRLFIMLLVSTISSFNPAAAVVEPLTLRVNDASVLPGGVLAVVVRTYSPRGVGQGQICLGGPVNETRGAGPLVELLEVRMWSDDDDVVLDSSFDPATQELIVDFDSPSAGVNRSDGPMLAALFRVDPNLPVDTEFELAIDPSSLLRDQNNQPIVVETEPGEMNVRDPDEPIDVDADGGDTAPGEWAEIEFVTEESFLLQSGKVVLLYDPTIAAGPVEVSMSERHGLSSHQVIADPGRVEVNFTSSDASLNRVPGQLILVRFQTHLEVPVPSSSPVFLGAETELIAADGQVLDLSLGDGSLTVVPRSEVALFADGFEDGDLDAWCVQVP